MLKVKLGMSPEDWLLRHLGKGNAQDILSLLRAIMINDSISDRWMSELKRLSKEVKIVSTQKAQPVELNNIIAGFKRLSDGRYMVPQMDPAVLTSILIAKTGKHCGVTYKLKSTKLDDGSPVYCLPEAFNEVLCEAVSAYKQYTVSAVFLSKLLLLVTILNVAAASSSKLNESYRACFRRSVKYSLLVCGFGYNSLLSFLNREGRASQLEVLCAGKSLLEKGEKLVTCGKDAKTFDLFYIYLYRAYPYLLSAFAIYKFCKKKISVSETQAKKYLAQSVHAEEMCTHIKVSLTKRGFSTENDIMMRLKKTMTNLEREKGVSEVRKQLIGDIDVMLYYPTFIKREVFSWF